MAKAIGHKILILSFLVVTRINLPSASSFGFFGLPNPKIHPILRLSLSSLPSSPPILTSENPLCDLQTFLRLSNLVQTGGRAKVVIQSGEVYLNGGIETRRAKKLFSGDEVSFGGNSLDVADIVNNRRYQYKAKKKKVKPVARVDANGNLEFGGRYRSETWRAERRERKKKKKF